MNELVGVLLGIGLGVLATFGYLQTQEVNELDKCSRAHNVYECVKVTKYEPVYSTTDKDE